MTAVRAPRVGPPWWVAAVLAVIAVVLAVLVVGVLPGAKHDRGNTVGNSALSSAEQAAVQAARTEAANLLTYARKSFDADWNRALAGATGQLKSDLAADKKTTQEQLVKNKFDLTATVTDVALAGGDLKGGYDVLVVANGHRVDDSGAAEAAVPSRIELTMKRVGGKWLAADLQGIELS